MSDLKKIFLTIIKEQRGLFFLFAMNFVLGFVLFVISIFSINTDAAVVKIGYGDIGGYKDGTWTDMLVFPIVSFLFGLIHPLICARLFEKHGKGIAKIFAFSSLLLVIILYFVFFRLVNEG